MIYMKKLVAISVLFVGLAAAVFAQDDEGKWKVGFMARYVTDMLFATSASGESTEKIGSDTYTKKFGEFNKGTIDFFGGHHNLPHPDNRMLLSISNSGENYDVYADIAFDDWDTNWGNRYAASGTKPWGDLFDNGGGILGFLLHGSADWYAKGNAGIFDAQIGTASRGGWVSTNATWNDWYGWNNLCRFGVWGLELDNNGNVVPGWRVGDDFRTWPEWGPIAAVGAGFGNFKFSLGYSMNNPVSHGNIWDGGATNASHINGSFMVNGRVTDAIAFDLFYAVKGEDPDTFSRPNDTGNPPAGKWDNIIGAYVGLGLVENLGLSLGYTANFAAYENSGFLPAGETEWEKSKPRTYTAPIFSGVDIHASYSGIDRIGLTFNNNLSFAGVKGEEIKADSEKIILNFAGNPYDKDLSQDWFHWDAELKASLSLVENLGLTVHLGNRLGVITNESSATVGGTTVTRKQTDTSNEFRVSVSAEYGIGGATIGTGLFFCVQSTLIDLEESGGGSTHTFKANSDTVKFGMPLLIKVAF